MGTWRGDTYRFTVTAATAAAGDTYTNNGQTFTVTDAIAGGTILYCFGTGAPSAAPSTLVRATGAGTNPISYSAFTNPNTNWGTSTNWSDNTVPTASIDAIFDANSRDCVVNASARVCKVLNFTNYANTITMSNNITTSGDITLGSGMTILGSGNLILNVNNGIYTSNGKTWPNSLTLQGTTSIGDNSTFTGDLTCQCASNALFTFTFNGDVTCRDLLYGSTGLVRLNGAKTIYINRNLNVSNPGGSGSNTGTTSLVMQGTGTLSCSTVSSTIANDLELIAGSGTITLGTNVAFANKTLKYTSGTLSVSGSTLYLAGATSWISNGATWGSLSLSNGTTTLTGNATVNNFTTITGGAGVTINQNTLNITGNLNFTSSLTQGTTVLNINGTLDQTWNGSAGALTNTNPLTIAKTTGTLFLTSTTLYYAGNITYSYGAMDPQTSTFVTTGGQTFNINSAGFTLYNWSPTSGVAIPSARIHTINGGTITVNNNLRLSNLYYTIFAGTGGWIAKDFTHTAAGVPITLQNGNTYTVTSVLNLTGTNASPIGFASDSATLRAIFTLSQGASQTVQFVSATRIDSSGGQTIWDTLGTGATLTNTLNWNSGAKPAPFNTLRMA
jgi:hypothetical protein